MDRLGLRILHYNSPGQSSWCSTTGVPPVPTHQCGPNYPVLLLLVLVAAGTASACKRWFLASGREGGVRSEIRKVRKMSKMRKQERQKAPTSASSHTTIAQRYFLKELQIPSTVTLHSMLTFTCSHFLFSLFTLSYFHTFSLVLAVVAVTDCQYWRWHVITDIYDL